MRWLGPLAIIVLSAGPAAAQDDTPTPHFVGAFVLDYGLVGADSCLTASDSCASGQLSLGYGLDLRYLLPSGSGIAARGRALLGHRVNVFPFELGYAHRFPPDVGGRHFLDASATLVAASVAGVDGDAAEGHWAFGLGATLAYTLRPGRFAGSIGAFGHFLPLTTSGDTRHYAIGLELRLGFDAPLR